MKLAQDIIVPFPGFHGTEGLCHVRVYEERGRRPVVIAGALDDNPGTSITNAIEVVAVAIKHACFRDGREFELIEHYPATIDGRGGPTFQRVVFSHADRDEHPPPLGTVIVTHAENALVSDGTAMPGDFREPRWERVDDVEGLVGCEVRTSPSGSYTARAVAGRAGERLRRRVAARSSAALERLVALVEGRTILRKWHSLHHGAEALLYAGDEGPCV